MPRTDVLLVSGSSRRASYNSALLREAAKALPNGVGHAWLPGVAALPLYSEDDDGERVPAAVGSAHDAFLPSGALRDPSLAAGLRDVVSALSSSNLYRKRGLHEAPGCAA